jgi:diguanylate cyclase (GGDEF)-like protein/PAS domain S-box-containing protein
MTLRVLLVEGNDEDARLLERALRRAAPGALVERVADRDAFEDALARGGHDVIVTEYALPGLTARDVVQALCAHPTDAPCILVSGRIGEEAVAEALRQGAADFVGKDRLSTLGSVITRTLRDRDARRARVKAEAALRTDEARYALAALATNDGLWDWDLRGSDSFVSDRWRELLGDPSADLEDWLPRVHPDDNRMVRSALAAHMSGATPLLATEHRVRQPDGSYRWVLVRGQAVRDTRGRATRMVGSMTDFTRRKEVEDALAKGAALHDALTGLPNRALLLDRLACALERATDERGEASPLIAVLSLDLDQFKRVNESLGHAAGDTLVVRVARVIEAVMRPGWTVARLGGDAFVLLLDHLHDPSEACRVAHRIQDALAKPVRVAGQDLYPSASIGIALARQGARADELLRDADTAMYRAKALGRARHVVFDTTMHARAVALLAMESDLRRALERDELRVWYQPVVRLRDGRLKGFEALARWEHPQRGLVSPSEFIPLAEECGLIVPIGREILHRACAQVAAWRRSAPWLGISVNLSGRHFAQPDVAHDVADALKTSGLAPEALTLEITETVLIGNPVAAEETLEQLHALRTRVSLDDFGTGYSSLGYLHRFRVDALKVDKTFVDRVGHDGPIVSTIASLAAHLGMEVVAEGVETPEQARLLDAMGIEAAQGWLYGRPVPAEDATALVERLAAKEPAPAG